MSSDVPHPYAIEVLPLDKPVGKFGWTIRKQGKLIERSDRPHDNEQKARASAMKAIEIDASAFDGRRR